MKAVAPQVKAIHCSIHREALATKKMSAELKTVLDEAVRAVSFIKIHGLFAILWLDFTWLHLLWASKTFQSPPPEKGWETLVYSRDVKLQSWQAAVSAGIGSFLSISSSNLQPIND